MLAETLRRGTASLTEWAADTGVAKPGLDRLFYAMDTAGTQRDHGVELQEPAVLVPELTAAPWHDPADYPFTTELEARFEQIHAEFTAQYHDLGAHPESVELAETGNWRTYYFYDMGAPHDEHLRASPQVAAAIQTIPGAGAAGMCYFSVMGPGTQVKPHCGFINARIRCHLGLSVPPDCAMRVGNETRTWVEGQCIVFDDSFQHEVYNRSDRPRGVLLLDVWHPDLTDVERRALTFLMRQWKSHVD